MNTKYFNVAEGIWQMSETKDLVDSELPFTGITDQFNFIVGEEWIILSLYSRQNASWKSVDDMYKLKIKWENSSLYYLPPVGDWVVLAFYSDGIFYMRDEESIRTYKKVEESNVPYWNKSILNKDREMYDYKL